MKPTTKHTEPSQDYLAAFDEGSVREELADHLASSAASLQRDGYSVEEATRLAAERLGDPHLLAREFAKIHPMRWLPIPIIGVLSAVLAILTAAMVIPGITHGGMRAVLAVHMGLVMLGYTMTLAIGAMCACIVIRRTVGDLQTGQFLSVRRAGLAWSSISLALTGIGMFIGSYCTLPKTGPLLGGLGAHEISGFVILAWDAALVAAFWFCRPSSPIPGTLSVGGGVLVLLGWFAATSLERSDYTWSTSLAALIVACHLPILLIPGFWMRSGFARPKAI